MAKKAKKKGRAITAELLASEVRFLLKTLLRDDLFGDSVALVEAEKLLDPSLSIPFADYCAFLRDKKLITVDRNKGLVSVQPAGKSAAIGGPAPDIIAALASHFADRIIAGSRSEVSEEESARALGDPGATQSLPIVRSVAAVGLLSSNKSSSGRSSPGRSSPGKSSPGKSSSAEALPEATLPEETMATLGEPASDLPISARPPDVGARYDLEEGASWGMPMGEGSLGVVYCAQDLTLDRPVGLKRLSHVFEYVTYIPSAELRRRLKEATLTQARLSSPHILDVVDLDFDASVPQVVTPWAAGGNLKQRLARAAADGVPMPIEVTMRILWQAAGGLDAAHAAGVTHGGLKPENILFDRAGNVLLSDFGLTQVTAKGALTGPPVYIGAGSTSYMAPEQLNDENTSPQGDVYALGILLYEMLTGRLPGRRSPMPSEKNKKAPKTIDDVFEKMTCDDLDERYLDAKALLDGMAASLPKKYVPEAGTLVLNGRDPWPVPDLPPPDPAEEDFSSEGSGEGLNEEAKSDGEKSDPALTTSELDLSSAEAAAVADIPSDELRHDETTAAASDADAPEEIASADAEPIDSAEAGAS